MQIVREHCFLPFLLIALTVLWSVYGHYDTLTWALEAIPVLLFYALAITTRRRFSWTTLSYWLFALGCVLVLVGAHYTYARMPIFQWLMEEFSLSRNHYDRFGHFFQGVVPAILFRELLLRTTPLRQTAWIWLIVVSLCTAKSVLYEFAEWWVVLALGEDAHDYLAMQGDIWDAQKDMLLATIGSLCALLFLSGLHDKQLRRKFPPSLR